MKKNKIGNNMILQDNRTLDDTSDMRVLETHDADVKAVSESEWQLIASFQPSNSVQDYQVVREALLRQEQALDFSYICRVSCTSQENKVDAILQQIRFRDDAEIYRQAQPRKGPGGQLHPRFAGDHFLSNVGLIEQTSLFKIARLMPKGAHLHLHFNSCLAPRVLLEIAKSMDRMFITSDIPLIADNGFENFQKCELQFSILTSEKERPGDLFEPTYGARNTMRFDEFITRFSKHYVKASVDEWLVEKLEFQEEEAYSLLQTAEGAWEKFNGRTRMMKGLFNYETAYRKYTRLFLQDLGRDNIQYAEIRPNFMPSNQLWTDDGKSSIDNRGIMKLIIQEVESFRNEMAKEGKFFGGVKVIYCTPRSFHPGNVKLALDECFSFKKEWPDWIAGFDLLGEEIKGRPLKDFLHEFIDFRRQCEAEDLDIPFLFHCGETLESGGETDENLADALLLGAKRIGHGFALSRHPYIMQQMKARNICLELCPISNEILGLTPRISGHTMYELLANNVHCTVNSDNGSLFRSTLSHDFYQVMIGKNDMGLFGWKQLVLWSLEHSCLSSTEKEPIMIEWQRRWKQFLDETEASYGHVLAPVEGSSASEH